MWSLSHSLSLITSLISEMATERPTGSLCCMAHRAKDDSWPQWDGEDGTRFHWAT